ncbi:MAG: nucleotidyltransferase family protein [Hyphomicrobiales bacterium]
MGEVNKLTRAWHGKPLVAHVVDAARSSALANVVVVTGHQAQHVAACVGDDALLVHNPDFATGMASSLRAGIREAQSSGADAVLVLLGDMPLVSAADIDRILRAFSEAGNAAIVQATCQGKPGNPVLIPEAYFDELLEVEGDKGARDLIKRYSAQRMLIEIGTAAARDFDVPEAFEG